MFGNRFFRKRMLIGPFGTGLALLFLISSIIQTCIIFVTEDEFQVPATKDIN